MGPVEAACSSLGAGAEGYSALIEEGDEDALSSSTVFVVNKVEYPPGLYERVQDHNGLLQAASKESMSMDMDPPLAPKSVLKKKPSSFRKSKHSRRVTFDEAVSFYCDDYPDIRFLALRSSSEVTYADLYFMFEPPPEYQDWTTTTCDPPAEYQDHRRHQDPRWDFTASIPPPQEIPAPQRKPVVQIVEEDLPPQEPPERYLPDLIEECSTSFNDYNEIEEGLLDELRKGEINEDISFETELISTNTHFTEQPATSCQQSNVIPLLSSEPACEQPLELNRISIVDDLKRTILEESYSDMDTRTNPSESLASSLAQDSQLDFEVKLKKQDSELSETSEIDLELENIAKEEEERANTEVIAGSESAREEPTENVIAEEDPDLELSETSSQIRKYFEENALTCSILRGIEARRRDEQRVSRPKSPLPSRDSLVEQLRRLTTMDEDDGNITGEDEEPSEAPSASEPRTEIVPMGPLRPAKYQEVHVTKVTHIQQAFAPFLPPAGNSFHPGTIAPAAMMGAPQYIAEEERVTTQIKKDNTVVTTTTVNKTFKTNRFKAHFEQTLRRHLADGGPQQQQQHTAIQMEEEASDELEQFVQQDIERIQRIKKRYSLAGPEEDEDPTFGFARRPSVRGIRTRFGSTTEILKQIHMNSSPPASATWHRLSNTSDKVTGYNHFVGRDPRYYSQGEDSAIYSTMNNHILPSSLWSSRDRRSAFIPLPSDQPPILPQTLNIAKDERGTPEGASSSPQVSSDSLYSAPSNETPKPSNGDTSSERSSKEDGVIYYSMNV